MGCNFRPATGSKVLYPSTKPKIIQFREFSSPFLFNKISHVPSNVKAITNKLIII